MVGQETPKKQSSLVTQDKAKARACLYVPTSDDCSLPPSATETLLNIGLAIIECADIDTAKRLCEEKTYALIILEECEDKDFFINIKSRGSLNEQTPVVLLFSDKLSDSAKELVQDQYIDDIIYKCATFDTDLGKAIKRLIDEPLQFAVTPKAKKSEPKKPEGSGTKRPRPDKTPISARKCILELPHDEPEKAIESGWSMGTPAPNTVPLHPLEEVQNHVCLDHTYANMDACPNSAIYTNQAQGYHASETQGYHANCEAQGYQASQLQQYQAAYAGMTNWQPPALHQYGYYADYAPQYHPTSVPDTAIGMLTAAVEMSLAQAQIPVGPMAVADTLEVETSRNTADKEGAEPMQQEKQAGEGKEEDITMDTSTIQDSQEQTSAVASQEDKETSGDQCVEAENHHVPVPSTTPSTHAPLPLPYPPVTSYPLHNEDLIPKITIDGARQLLDTALQGAESLTEEQPSQLTAALAKSLTPVSAQKSPVVTSDKVTPVRGSKRKRASLTPRGEGSGTPSRTPTTAEERKEAHLAKERKRRERIARCWFILRRMIPSCSETADKATVFEMTVAYIHHCWKHHIDLVRKVNQDFQQLCSVTPPPDEMDALEGMVDGLLNKEPL